MKDKGIESLIDENLDFDVWCNIVGQDILNETYLDKDNISFKIKSHIMNNEHAFYRCLISKLESRIDILKKKIRLVKRGDQKTYLELGYELSELNARLKKYNIERTKAFQRNDYKMFKDFLKEKGHGELIMEFHKLR